MGLWESVVAMRRGLPSPGVKRTGAAKLHSWDHTPRSSECSTGQWPLPPQFAALGITTPGKAGWEL